MIIAIMVAAMISTMVIGAGKLVTNEVRINTRYRDEQVAYYAAEAGIEKGLALMKANPSLYNSRTNTSAPIPNETSIPLGNDAIYDLSIWRLAPKPIYAIDKDQTIEFGLDNMSSWLKLTYLSADIEEPAGVTCPKDICVYLEATQYQDELVDLSQTPVSQDLLGKAQNNFLGDITHRCSGGWKQGATLTLHAAAKTLRLRPYVMQYELPEKLNVSPLDPNQNVQRAILGPYLSDNRKLSPDKKCLYHLSIQGESVPAAGRPIDQGYTTIRSVGKYRQVQKVLEAKLSNMSGKALEIFDYVIYAGEKLDVK